MADQERNNTRVLTFLINYDNRRQNLLEAALQPCIIPGARSISVARYIPLLSHYRSLDYYFSGFRNHSRDVLEFSAQFAEDLIDFDRSGQFLPARVAEYVFPCTPD